MSIESMRRLIAYVVGTAFVIILAGCSHMGSCKQPFAEKNDARIQLSIGYTLLYQEADGIPKLKWILMFKDKSEKMGNVTSELMSYYEQLAVEMRRLSKQFPAMKIDVVAMSEIEGEERKALGKDVAKDFAPLVGKIGVDFEREALLTFDDALNEQRHLTGVMLEHETDPGLRKFLERTREQLDSRYAEVALVLNRHYFTH